jgi:sugar lactone lactonase YvrE
MANSCLFRATLSASTRSILRTAMLSALAGLTLLSWSARGFAAQSLWIGAASPGPGVEEIMPRQLKQSGAPAVQSISESATQNAAGIAFQNGNMWVTTFDNTVLEFSSKQLKKLSEDPAPAPVVTITSSSFGFILTCVVDKRGNLWIADSKIDGVHEFSKAQLAGGSSNVTPAVTITSDELASPAFATFDKKGNLWVTSEGNNRIVEFTVDQLTGNGATVPAVIISSPSLNGPGQAQFDRKGTLWVTNALNSTVTGFTKDQLTASGSPVAAVILSATAVDSTVSLDTPWGLQFDAQGNLWVFNYTSGASPASTLAEFGKNQLKASGAPVPQEFLTGLALYSAQLTFGPSSK